MRDLDRELRAHALDAAELYAGEWRAYFEDDDQEWGVVHGDGDPVAFTVEEMGDGARHIAAWHPARAVAALDVIAAAREWKDAPLGERGDSSPEENGALTKLFHAVQRWDETK